MRSKSNELYEDWCERARGYELNLALGNLAKGQSIDQTIDIMSYRLMNKLMDPLYDLARNEVDLEYDKEKSNLEYKKNYLDKVNPVADHVVQDN